MLFSDVKYTISSSYPLHRQDELAKVLNANGASKADLVEATHVITDTLRFEGRDTVADDVNVVTVKDEWVDRSVVHGKQQDPKLFSADPNMIFSGVIACTSDLEACDNEVISAGINALGGLFREGYTRDCTHVLAARPGSDKYNTALHYQPATRVHVVLPHWFDDCVKLFVRLSETQYSWPNPPILRSGYELEKARLPDSTKTVIKTAMLAEETEQGRGKAIVTTQKDIWHGRRILLSSSLALEKGRREAVEVSVQRAGGQAIELTEDEDADVGNADVYITQFRTGSAFVKALRANKTVGTLSWLFNVHKTGVVSRPQDQLLHFPIRPEPIHDFSGQKITATNYETDARRYVKKLIELMGGEFTPQMTASNTAVIAAFIKGDKTTKAREWNIPVVNHTWLEDCFIAWTLLTPAQEKYVSFPAGVNFGMLVGKRGVEPLGEDELQEIEKADKKKERLAVEISEREREERERAEREEREQKEQREKEERERRETEEFEREQKDRKQEVMDIDYRHADADDAMDQDETEPSTRPQKKSKAAAKPKPGPSRSSAKPHSESDGDDDEELEHRAPKTKSAATSDTKRRPSSNDVYEEIGEEVEAQPTRSTSRPRPLKPARAPLRGKKNGKSKEVESEGESENDEDMPLQDSPARKATPERRNNAKSKAVDEEEEEEVEEECEIEEPPRRRGRPAKGSVPANKANGKAKVVESDEEDEGEKHVQRRGRPAKYTATKVNGKSKVIDVGDDNEGEQPRRVGRPKKSTSAKCPPADESIVATIKSKPTPTKLKSVLSLLNADDLDTSSDEGLPPIRSTKKAASPPSHPRKDKERRIYSAEEEEEEEEEEENTSPKAVAKVGRPRGQKPQKAAAGPSKVSTTRTQKARLRTQPSLLGPTPGKTVAVEITSPRKPIAVSGRTGSLVTVAADGASTHATPKRGRPGARSPPPKPSDERPLSSPNELARVNQFSEEAIRRSSLPSPIAGSSGYQRLPSRRQAATKATMRLSEIAPDILNFQKEMRTGAIRGPWEDKGKGKAKEEPDEGGKKRRASAVSEHMSDESDAEQLDTRDKKKRKVEENQKITTKRDHDEGAVKKMKKKPRLSNSITDDEDDRMQNSSRVASDTSGICLMTTQVTLADNIIKGLKQLGVKVTTKPSECTLLLANGIGRTEKFLCAMASARSVVTEKWAVDSVHAKQILPTEKYFLKDPEGEKKHKFKLSEALQRAQSSGRKLLEGHTFYFTKKLFQSDKFNTYKNVILSAGGKVVSQNPTVRMLKNHKDRHVLSTDDDTVWQGLADEGFHIYVAEFILMGILTQKMEWGSRIHRLDNNP